MTDKDTHPNAGRASGYTDERGNDVSENIINRVTELMIGPQTKMLVLADQMNAIVTTQDQRFEYLLGQMDAFLKKEDARHDALAESEDGAMRVLASVARQLDEISGYMEQSLARLGKVEKSVIALKKGQIASEKQVAAALILLQESKEDRADLRHRIEALSAVVEEHNRVAAESTELARKVADLEAWRAELEARNG